MTTTEPDDQKHRTIDASFDQPFYFEQGASLHVGILGMVGRPSGSHDEAPFVVGICHDGRSQCDLDLSQLEESEPEPDAPALHLWFDPEHTVLDISGAFADVPVEALEGSGIPPAVVDGPIAVERSGDAGDGAMALLTQMCAGKIVIDPSTMLRLIASDHLQGFAEHQVQEDGSVRAFNAQLSIAHFLIEAGLTTTTLVNQIAVLGLDIRTELGKPVVAALDDFLRLATVQLAWLVDDSDRIQTAQAMFELTEFFTQVFSNEHVIAQLAAQEQVSVAEMTEFIQESIEAGRLVYVHAIWQTFDFDRAVDPVIWPQAIDLTADVATQAAHLRTQAEEN